MTRCKTIIEVSWKAGLYSGKRVYTIADMFGHFYTLELVMVHCCSLPAACAHPRKVQRHHPMDIYKIRHLLSPVSDTLPICLPLNIYFLIWGLVITMASRSCLSVTSASSSAMMGEM